MTQINIDKDRACFVQTDNPIVQYKDAMQIFNDQSVTNAHEELSTVLSGSLFQLSSEEFANFVKHDELFNQFPDKELFGIMLVMSVIDQLNYDKLVLPKMSFSHIKNDPDSVVANWSGASNRFLLDNTLNKISSNIHNYGDFTNNSYEFGKAHLKMICNSHTSNQGFNNLDEAKEVFDFFEAHYTNAKMIIRHDKDVAVPEIVYDVDAKKLPILVQHQLYDCGKKAIKFINNAYKKAYTSIDDDIIYNLVDSLIALNCRNRKNLRQSMKNMSDVLNELAVEKHLASSQEIASSISITIGLLQKLLTICGHKKMKLLY